MNQLICQYCHRPRAKGLVFHSVPENPKIKICDLCFYQDKLDHLADEAHKLLTSTNIDDRMRLLKLLKFYDEKITQMESKFLQEQHRQIYLRLIGPTSVSTHSQTTSQLTSELPISKYWCPDCNYQTNKTSSYKLHLKSKRHLSKTNQPVKSRKTRSDKGTKKKVEIVAYNPPASDESESDSLFDTPSPQSTPIPNVTPIPNSPNVTPVPNSSSVTPVPNSPSVTPVPNSPSVTPVPNSSSVTPTSSHSRESLDPSPRLVDYDEISSNSESSDEITTESSSDERISSLDSELEAILRSTDEESVQELKILVTYPLDTVPETEPIRISETTRSPPIEFKPPRAQKIARIISTPSPIKLQRIIIDPPSIKSTFRIVLPVHSSTATESSTQVIDRSLPLKIIKQYPTQRIADFSISDTLEVLSYKATQFSSARYLNLQNPEKQLLDRFLASLLYHATHPNHFKIIYQYIIKRGSLNAVQDRLAQLFYELDQTLNKNPKSPWSNIHPIVQRFTTYYCANGQPKKRQIRRR